MGCNATYDDESITPLAGTNLAHAEIVALQLKRGEHETGSTPVYHLEPCPMCFGAIVMTGLESALCRGTVWQIRSAYQLPPYRQQADFSRFEGSSLEVPMPNHCLELGRQHPRQEVMLSAAVDCPEGVALGTRLFQEGFFHSL